MIEAKNMMHACHILAVFVLYFSPLVSATVSSKISEINASQYSKIRQSAVDNNLLRSSKTQGYTKLMNKTSADDGTGCSCVRKTYDCGCCTHLKIKQFGLDDTACLNLTYLVHDYGIAFTFSIDGKVYYRSTISARNPPPVCFGLPHLHKEASICLDFYDLDVSKGRFRGCARLEAEFIHIKVLEVKLGCFHIPLSAKLPQALLQDQQALEAFMIKQKDFVAGLNMLRAKKLLQ